ncbi:MAG: tRNA1(Val) (adenine(37)-N6)-methyltransferase [Chitinophagaceae bacterium]
MPQPFHFKQFTIYHTCNSMKVCTDACVFGAMVANFLFFQKHILYAADIGAGTGLLSCMIQQKNAFLKIDALEIEYSFCEEMQSNIKTCQFDPHITILNKPLQEYILDHKYEVIFSNPPFFINQMLSPNHQRRQSRHAILLPPQDIFLFTKKYLKKDGLLCLLLPFIDVEFWIKASHEIGLFIYKRINIKTNIGKNYTRVILYFTFISCILIKEEFIYTNASKEYTQEFKQLLKDYYISL